MSTRKITAKIMMTDSYNNKKKESGYNEKQ